MTRATGSISVALWFAIAPATTAWAQPHTVTGNPATSYVRDSGPHSRPVDLSALAGTPGVGLVGFGGGLRIGLPLVHDGFIGSLNNAVKLETGAEFYHWSFLGFSYESVAIPIQMRWDFYLTADWVVFAALGVAINVYNFDEDGGFFAAPDGVSFFSFGSGGVITTAVGFGAMFNLSESLALRLDASANLLAIGLTLRL